MPRSKLAYLFLIIALLGFLDATFLTIEHYRGVVPPCAIVTGCANVTTSSYSAIFGIPVALLGALYYLSVLLLTITYLDTKNARWLKLGASVTPVGFLASLWFVYLQGFVLKAWCLYCLISIITSTLLFIAGLIVLTQKESWWERLKTKI